MDFLCKSEYEAVVGRLTPIPNYRSSVLTPRKSPYLRGRLQDTYQYLGAKFGSALGEPPFTDPNTENNQGVWLWDDEGTGFRYCYYTDCWKKDHYKGGSLECTAPPSTRIERVLEGASRFLAGLKEMSGFIPDPE